MGGWTHQLANCMSLVDRRLCLVAAAASLPRFGEKMEEYGEREEKNRYKNNRTLTATALLMILVRLAFFLPGSTAHFGGHRSDTWSLVVD